MLWLIIFVTLTAGLVVTAAARFVFQESRRAQALDRRLAGVRAWAVAVYGEPQARRTRQGAGLSLHGLLTGVLNIASMLVPVGAAERAKLRQLLAKAGFPQSDALSVFMTAKLVASLVGGGLLGVQAARGQWLGDYSSTSLLLLVGLVGAVIGGLTPEIGLRQLVTRRHRRMVGALPDALDLMTLCLESGLTFERTLSRVASELGPMAPDLARELALVEAELRLGADRKAVLSGLYTRTEVDGLRDMATTIVHGERYGTPLAESMHNIARNERVQRKAPDGGPDRTAAGADEPADAAAGDAGHDSAGRRPGLPVHHGSPAQYRRLAAADLVSNVICQPYLASRTSSRLSPRKTWTRTGSGSGGFVAGGGSSVLRPAGGRQRAWPA